MASLATPPAKACDLRLHSLLAMREEPKLAPLSTPGYTLERRYTLRPPFTADQARSQTPRAPAAKPSKGKARLARKARRTKARQ